MRATFRAFGALVLVLWGVGCGLPEQFREPCIDPAPEQSAAPGELTCAIFDGFEACVPPESAGRAMSSRTYARILAYTAAAWEEAGYQVRDCLRERSVSFQVFETEDALVAWCGWSLGKHQNLHGCSFAQYSAIAFVPDLGDYTPVVIHEIGHLAAACATGDDDAQHALPVWWHDGADAPTYQAYAAEAAYCGAEPAPWVPFRRSTTRKE